jgi:hypothetical protein
MRAIFLDRETVINPRKSNEKVKFSTLNLFANRFNI